jgi:hypothetical protein
MSYLELAKKANKNKKVTEVFIPNAAPKPYLDSGGDAVIPFTTDPKYQYWNGGQPINQTILDLLEEQDVI